MGLVANMSTVHVVNLVNIIQIVMTGPNMLSKWNISFQQMTLEVIQEESYIT